MLIFWNKYSKYGNDDDYADDLGAGLSTVFFEEVFGRPNTQGAPYRVELSFHHLPRLFRLRDRRHPRRPQGLGAHSDGNYRPVQAPTRTAGPTAGSSNRPPRWTMRATGGTLL